MIFPFWFLVVLIVFAVAQIAMWVILFLMGGPCVRFNPHSPPEPQSFEDFLAQRTREVKLNMENLKIEYQHRSQFDGAECAPGWVCNGGVHCFHASADFGGEKYAVQMPFSDDVSFKEMLSYVGLSLDRLLKRKREMAGIN
jgi:hypothetical protein